MKPRFITIGTVVASIALGQALAIAEDAAKNTGANKLQSATSGQQVTGLEGRIMSLHAYLSGSSAWTSDNAGSATTDRSPSATTSPQFQRDRSQTTDASAESARSREEREKAKSTTTTSPSDRSATAANPSAPAWQGWAGTGAATSDQPLVFVAMRGTSTPLTSSSSATTDRTVGSPSVASPTVGSLATASTGEAYVLLCNSSDATSRSAFSKAQSVTPGATPSTSDRLQVRGKDESDATTRRPEDPARQPADPARQPATDRSTSQDYKPYAQNYGHGILEGKLVKISGKILSRGGIQAIEVASIDEVAATSTPGSTSAPGSTSGGSTIK